MLRLFPDYNDGSTELRCPVCHRRLVLAAERMGRMVVTYDHGFRIRPGRPALLVCPDYDCPYREPVEIAATSDDAIAFSPLAGGHSYFMEHHLWERTFGEVKAELLRLMALRKQTANPKLPAAIHRWREQYEFLYWNIKQYLTQSYEQDKEVVLEGKADDPHLRGKVRALLHDAFLFDRTDNGETVLIHTADLRTVALWWNWVWKRHRFDFGPNDDAHRPKGMREVHLPSRFVVVNGYTLQFEGVTRYGVCRASTEDPAIAQSLGIFHPREMPYTGEFPRALVERCFLVVRYARIGGHRLMLLAGATHPDYFSLRTRDMAAAKALQMNVPHMIWDARRQYLFWEGFFHRSELDAIEEIQVTVRVPRKRSRRR